MLAALVVAVSVHSGIQHLDHVAVSDLHEEALENGYDWTLAVNKLGSNSVTLAVACVSALLLGAMRRPRWALTLGLAYVLCRLEVVALKAAVDRPRPPAGVALRHAGGSGFPSGHSAGAMVVYGTLALLAGTSMRGLQRITILCLGALVVTGVGWSGVYLGVRYPTDVLAGWLTAAVAILIAWGLIELASSRSRIRPAQASFAAQSLELPHSGIGRRGPALDLRRTLKRIPGLVAAVHGARRARKELNALAYSLIGWIGDFLAGTRSRARFRSQAVLEWSALLPGVADERLISHLEAQGIDHDVSESAVYIPSQPGLEGLLGDTRLYPKDAIFKVMRSDDHSKDAVLVGNLLHLQGLAPRIYDEFSLVDGGLRRSVFVIRDPGRDLPSGEQKAEALASISGLVESGDLMVADSGWERSTNLRTDGANSVASYVGFENFRLANPRRLVATVLDEQARRDLHYGSEYALKGGRYFYQTIPAAHLTGRRNSRRRWNTIHSMLEEANISLDGRVMLDLGCNAGMMMAATLADGAAWALGWDLPQVVRHGRRLMLALGYTRFDMLGAELTRDYPLVDDVPASLRHRLEGAIVLYLAFRHNVGYFLSALGDLPWTALVYEGSEDESLEDLPEYLGELRGYSDFEVVSAVDFRDSETDSRPLALLLRS